MVSIGTEGRTLVNDPDTKYPQCIKQRDHQNSKANCRSSVNWKIDRRHLGNIDKFNDQYRMYKSNEQRARIAHENFGGLKIKYQKCCKASCK